MGTAPESSPEAALDPRRAEHDALAERLAVRRSVDEARSGFYLVFAGLVSVGLTVKLAWDRWGVLPPGVERKIHPGPPMFLLVAGTVAVILLLLCVRAFVRSRRLMREEDALFARYRELRAGLGLDP
jgi:hypothetical protein